MKANRKPIEYLKTNNNVLPHFESSITHITRDATYFTVAVEYNKYKIVTTSNIEDIAKPNAAQTLYYLVTEDRMPESKYGDYTNIISTEMENIALLKESKYQHTDISKQKFQAENLIAQQFVKFTIYDLVV